MLQRTNTHYSTLAILAVLGVAALAMLYFVDPDGSAWYPHCTLYQMTGLYCPGCGGLRGTHRLLHGDIPGALRMNALAFTLLPAVGVTWVVNQVRRARYRKAGAGPPSRLLPAWTGWAVVILIVAFTITRNIPYEPFIYLAPN